MAGETVVIKDPNAVLDYGWDWGEWLDGDTITASSWTPETGITVDDHESTDSTAVVWLSGGTAGEQYAVTNRITTAAGRTDDRTLTVIVTER